MRILSIAHALPSRLVTNEALVEHALQNARASGVPAGDLTSLSAQIRVFLERSGAGTRYHRSARERAVDFGTAAGLQALEEAAVPAASVGLLIYAGVGRGFLEPATANVFQDALGAYNATCFDVMDACASWLRAIDIAQTMLRSGRHEIAMILNCEFNFHEFYPAIELGTDPDEWLPGLTVGEAATATVIIRDAAAADAFHVDFRNSGHGYALCQIPLPNAAQFLNGHHNPRWRPMRFYARSASLHKVALEGLARQYCSDARFTDFDYDVIFGHSVSVATSARVIKKLGLDGDKHYEIFPRYGNTVSASLPLAMSLAIDEDKLHRGDNVLLLVGSAGVTTAVGTLRY